jgi:hypothetical protein
MIGDTPDKHSIALHPSGWSHFPLSETGSWLVEHRKKLKMRISIFSLGFPLSKNRVFSCWGGSGDPEKFSPIHKAVT